MPESAQGSIPSDARRAVPKPEIQAFSCSQADNSATLLTSTSGDKVDLSNGMSVTARVEYDELTYFDYVMEALGVLFR